MTYIDIARTQLRIDEGVRTKPYIDTVGKLSIGVGRNLDDVGVRPDEIALMLENDLAEAEKAARILVKNFDELSPMRKAVVLNMAFNLGINKLGQFVNTLRAINEGRFGAAADGMKASKWYGQVGERGRRLVEQMRNG